MAKIIKLTEQDLYRIVKRVIMESENETEGIIVGCFKQNATFDDAVKAAEFFLKCDSCRRIVWLTGIKVFENIMSSGEFKIPQPGEIIKIIMNNPEISQLAVPCGQEMINYYKGMSEKDKTEFKNKMASIASCIVTKLFSGGITPADFPLPTGVELPDGFPFPSDIPGMDDVINKGTEMINKGMENLDDWMKQTGGGQFPKI
jgi:hypothetical protein